MIKRFDDALCALQSAAFGREIYGADHPQVATQVTRAASLLHGLLAERRGLSFMAFDDRVVFDDRRLPSGASLASGLIARLRRRGVESVTFSPGLTEPELTDWLSQFDKDAPVDTPATGTPHIRVGSIDRPHAADQAGQADPDGFFQVAPDGELELDGAAPRRLIDGIFDADGPREPDLGAVGTLIDDLSQGITRASGAMLPLATLKHHDEYTSVHTLNVAMMSTALAEQVGLSAHRVHQVAVGAVLHDLGKRDVPPELLNKPGKLSEREFAAIQVHPAAGARALLEMKNVPEAAVIIAYEHHMHLDGTGYPRQRGRRPHLASQIVQLADVYDALRTHRPYRAALSLTDAARIMRSGAGSKYDAGLLELFFDRVAVRTSPADTRAA